MALKERMDSPFSKGRKIPLAGRLISWRGQGEDKSLFQRETKIPLAGRSFMEGPGGGFRNTSPRPLQATPTPSSGFGVTFTPLPAIGICRARHGRIKDKALTEVQNSFD